jgi:hypothetical protein
VFCQKETNKGEKKDSKVSQKASKRQTAALKLDDEASKASLKSKVSQSRARRTRAGNTDRLLSMSRR